MPDRGRHSLIARALALIGICAVAAIGALGAVAAPGVVAGGLFCAVLIALATGARVRDIATGDRAARAAAGRRAGVVVGGVLAVGSMVVAGAALLLGPAAAVLLLLVPVIIGGAWWLRHTRSTARALPFHPTQELLLRVTQPPVPPAPDPALPHAALPVVGPSPAGLSTAQLCLAWQHSYFAMLDLPASASRADLVQLRHQLLDEIERRDPAGFTRWIDTEARPGSNPGRYVVGEG